jgi:hypothetical protein
MRLRQKVRFPLTELLPNKNKLVSFFKNETQYLTL